MVKTVGLIFWLYSDYGSDGTIFLLETLLLESLSHDLGADKDVSEFEYWVVL
jgi:hypothetical protein